MQLARQLAIRELTFQTRRTVSTLAIRGELCLLDCS